jgi:glycosyltransferase involved in cell wall biosynthesis
MKKVLIIARSFPPLNASGTFRPTKFVKYLSQFGWQPYVISADHSADQENKPVTLDQNLLNNITSDTKVWYIPIPRPKPVQRLANLVGWRSRDVADQRDMHSAKDSALVHLLVQKYTIAKRLRRILLSPLYLIQHPPIDEYLYWAFKIIPKARRIIREENIDVILTTSPPWSVLLSGLILKRITGKPWLADMRDLWTIDSRYNSMGLIKWFDRFVERITLCYADKVIGVTPGGVADLRCLLKCKDKDSIHLITNGYDPDDYIDSTKRISSVPQKIKLYHPGSVYKGGLKPLIRAVEKVKEQNRNLELTIEFVGYVHPEDLHRLSQYQISVYLIILQLLRCNNRTYCYCVWLLIIIQRAIILGNCLNTCMRNARYSRSQMRMQPHIWFN